MNETRNDTTPVIRVRDLTIGYDRRVVLKNLNFDVQAGEIFGILGGSGCGKSTLLKHMIGLYEPMTGNIDIFGQSITDANDAQKRKLMRQFGVTYQGGALFGSMTVGENVALPLQEFTTKTAQEIAYTVAEKLDLVGLKECVHYMPSELSGGMRKRAGLARALALDPKLLFFDEPSAGLDPITSVDLDHLILDLKKRLGSTIVIVTHELASIYTVMDRVVMLDKETRSIAATGTPEALREHSDNAWVRAFLNREPWAEISAEHATPEMNSVSAQATQEGRER